MDVIVLTGQFMKKLIVTAVALLISAVSALAADVSGKWTGQMQTPDGNAFPISYTLKQDGMTVTGTTEGPGGAIEIKEGKVEGDKVSFHIIFEGGQGAMKIMMTGTVSGEEMTMSMGMEGGPQGGFPPFKLTRSK
jgi:hypothetical protein